MVVVKYYFKQGCPACIQFKPEWDKLCRELDRMKIEHIPYEYLGKQNEDEFIKADIEGFPTIRFYCCVDAEKGCKHYIYTGKHDVRSIYDKVMEILKNEEAMKNDKEINYQKSVTKTASKKY